MKINAIKVLAAALSQEYTNHCIRATTITILDALVWRPDISWQLVATNQKAAFIAIQELPYLLNEKCLLY